MDDAFVVKARIHQFGAAVERMHLEINALRSQRNFPRFTTANLFPPTQPFCFISGIRSTISPRNLRQLS